uniref:Strictosidine synthase conserved region domain-containing protein n=1 Tax=Panagrolaimus davidi TaxID=227884 RepID=A0A914PHH5_9BILA
MAMPEMPALTGALSPNKHLQNAKILFKNEIHGPESFVWLNGALYSTVENGFIKIINDKIVKKIQIGKSGCLECGRPLGMRHYKDETFIVADCYNGILTVDFKTGKIETLLPGGTIVDGIKLNFADDLDFIDKDTIIFSDASTTWDLTRFSNAMLELKGDGRVLKFNLKTKEISTLLTNLQFANGIQIHSDKQSVLICETGAARIVRYFFDGPKKGTHEYFVTNLPGLPDNIRASSKGTTYYIAFAIPRVPNHWSFIDSLAPYPFIRKLILQIIPESLGFTFYRATMANYGLFVEADTNGKIIKSWHDPTGFTKMISQVIDADDAIYVGSYAHEHLAKIYKNQL